MARPPKITDEQILEAAHAMFLEHGPDVTTMQIARHAGISEGTIFKRFKTKEQLFTASMTKGMFTMEWIQSLNELSGKGDLKANLERITREMLAFFNDLIPRAHMVMSRHGSHMKDMFQGNPNSPPLFALRHLVTFLQTEQSLGRLRHAHAELIAHMLMGSIHHYAFMSHSELDQWLECSAEDYIEGVIEHLFGSLIINTS